MTAVAIAALVRLRAWAALQREAYSGDGNAVFRVAFSDTIERIDDEIVLVRKAAYPAWLGNEAGDAVARIGSLAGDLFVAGLPADTANLLAKRIVEGTELR